MQKYELTIVLDAKATAAKQKSVTEKIKKIVATLNGKVGKIENWGKKDLAYRIGENEIGIFLLFNLELTPEAAKALAGKLRLEEEIIRYLLVRKEKSA